MPSYEYRGLEKAIKKHIKTKDEFLREVETFKDKGSFQSGEYDSIKALIEEEYPD